jgi:DNA-binding response OmpR family regulator
MKVLVAEDDLALSDVLSFTLRRAGYETVVAHDGQTALSRWQDEAPDLILLDLNLPKLDGLSVCRRIHANDETPIIILSVRDEDDDIVSGLELGADDYVVKPFSPRQLVARIEAVLRRVNHHAVAPGLIRAGGFTLDPARHELFCCDEPLGHLTKLECRMLEVLMQNCGQVVPRDSLIDFVWGAEGADSAMLKQVIYRLRRKFRDLRRCQGHIDTVAGVGYSFVTQASK